MLDRHGNTLILHPLSKFVFDSLDEFGLVHPCLIAHGEADQDHTDPVLGIAGTKGRSGRLPSIPIVGNFKVQLFIGKIDRFGYQHSTASQKKEEDED